MDYWVFDSHSAKQTLCPYFALAILWYEQDVASDADRNRFYRRAVARRVDSIYIVPYGSIQHRLHIYFKFTRRTPRLASELAV